MHTAFTARVVAIPLPRPFRCAGPGPRSRARGGLLRGSDKRIEVPESVRPQWDACAEALEVLGLERKDADKAIGSAFGWGKKKKYWQGAKQDEVPDVQRLAEALEFLSSVGIAAPEDQGKVVKDFPQVLGLSPDLMQHNVNKLKQAYRMKGSVLASSVKRKPKVLGAITDCEGDCEGNCSRCFAQF
ncbi:CGL50 [Auxenochlorella protothecoides x Auxenochlorella symbiontica]|uniref:Uncharacterized protein n=1 Tax=Auxenochlorella protothecoides TaxID=3075 RepID=A0A087SKK2_AUXPR|nr:hypothetical protein F751_4749 [Auxenochlorella protothecoides]KFM26256.1 hypothetical protein F751_4749 [Auxenochlorella protothecoides]RMZ56755.1 hypothetical protein APUTEX25_002844 [Auxenochlorella protothecoides]|eukprot:RMZ56755.1 hypothetical protein APUTEX25_002844 [Auxenochlorella protothecoides]